MGTSPLYIDDQLAVGHLWEHTHWIGSALDILMIVTMLLHNSSGEQASISQDLLVRIDHLRKPGC